MQLAGPNIEGVNGLSKDRNTFYTSFDDARELGKKIRLFKEGRIVILVPNMPIPCPGAPPKFSIMLADYLRYVRGEEIRKNVEISLLWPTAPIGPPAYNAVVEETCKEKSIEVRRSFNFEKVDESKKEVSQKKGIR